MPNSSLPVLLLSFLLFPFCATAQEGDYPQRRRNLTERNWEDQDYIYRQGEAGEAEVGDAIFYADYLHGQPTAFGETYDRFAMTCAHHRLPQGAILRVTRVENNKSIVVRVNDRGAYAPGVVVQLSRAAAASIDLLRAGRAKVQVTVIGYSATNPQPGNKGNFSPQPQAYDAAGGRLATKGQPVKASPPKDLARGYAIQLASYRDLDNAQRQANALTQQGLPRVFLRQDTKTGTTLFKVVTGFFESRPHARAYLDQLKTKYLLDGYILQLN